MTQILVDPVIAMRGRRASYREIVGATGLPVHKIGLICRNEGLGFGRYGNVKKPQDRRIQGGRNAGRRHAPVRNRDAFRVLSAGGVHGAQAREEEDLVMDSPTDSKTDEFIRPDGATYDPWDRAKDIETNSRLSPACHWCAPGDLAGLSDLVDEADGVRV